MQKDSSIFRIPFQENVKTPEASDFDAVAPITTVPIAATAPVKTGGEFEFYSELKTISEEIEKCRLRNC